MNIWISFSEHVNSRSECLSRKYMNTKKERIKKERKKRKERKNKQRKNKKKEEQGKKKLYDWFHALVSGFRVIGYIKW